MPSIAHLIRRRHNRKARQAQTRHSQRLWSGLVIGTVALAILIPLSVIFGLAGILYFRSLQHMPSSAETIYLDPIIGATDLLDRNSTTVLYSVQDPLGNNRRWLNIETLPQYVIDATIQQEDPDYLRVGGFRFFNTVERLWNYILGYPVNKDISIAGRLADTTLVPPARESNLDDALLHLVYSAEVQRRFTPRRVLEWYLNTAYYGNDAYGIDAAAQVYFAKSAVDLTLDEAAMLAAIPLAPRFNPFDDEVAARGRQSALLRDMENAGLIDTNQFDIAAATETTIRSDLAQVPFIAPDFSIYAREQAEDLLNAQGLDGARLIARGGLSITTTLDLDMYYQTECLLRVHLAQLNNANPASVTTLHNQPCVASDFLGEPFGFDTSSMPDSGSIVLHDVQTGEILTMVGAATETAYEPGPVLHPFVYLSGFLSGNSNPAKMLLDIPQDFAGVTEGSVYIPSNPDGVYRGPINLRDAMVANLLTPVAEVADREGLSSVLSIAHQIGINSLRDGQDANIFDLSLVERGGTVSVLDVTYAYSVFASMGAIQGVDTEPVGIGYRSRDPIAVLKIEDAEGNILWEYTENDVALNRIPRLEPEIAYLVNDILSDNSTRRGVLNLRDEPFNVGRPAAVVNGLTQNQSDSWTVGYTPQLAIGVHLRRNDDEAMSLSAYGYEAATPIWQALTRFAHERYNHQAAGWARPEKIVDYVVCEKSGLIPPPNSDCNRRSEIFHIDAPPTQEDIYWRTVRINSDTGQLASSTTPAYLVVERTYFEPPSPARDWWVSNNLELPPTTYDTLSVPDEFQKVQINAPADFSYVGGSVEIRGFIEPENLVSWRLRYGAGLNPTSWINIGEVQTTYEQGQSLGTWNTSNLDSLYTVELSAEYSDGSRSNTAVQVTVDNIPPTVRLNTIDDSQLYRFPVQTTIPLRAEVDDNFTIDRVEFYHNGVLVYIDEAEPFEFDFIIERTGIEIFNATAFDRVGNEARAELELEVIRGTTLGQ